MVTVDVVTKLLSPSWLFFAIKRYSVFMHEARAAANMSSGTQYPSLPPNDGGGLTVAIVFPFIVRSHSVPLFQVAVPSNFISGTKTPSLRNLN